MPFLFPREMTGVTKEDLERLWEDLWKVVEELNLLEERMNMEEKDGRD